MKTKIVTLVGFVCSIAIMLYQTFGHTGHIDMIVYRAGAHAYLDGLSLYDEPFDAYDLKLPFIYPPFAALLLSPFTVMSEAVAGYTMVGLSALLLLVCVWFVAKHVFPQHALLVTSWAWGLGLMLEPVRHNAGFGQINMWLLALVLLDIVPRKRVIPQGWLIGVAAAIKLTPVVMLFVFLIKKDVRALVSAAVGFVLATAAGMVHNPKQTWDFYTHALFVMNDNSKIGVNIAYISNQSIKGVLTRLWPSNEAASLASSTISLLWLIASLIAVGVFFFLIRALLRQGKFFEAALANSALMLLISPISWSHHWVWWPVWLMVIFSYAWTLKNQGLRNFALIITFLMLTLPPHWWLGDPTGDQDFQQTLYMKLFMDDYFFWSIALTAVLIKWVRGRTEPPQGAGTTDADESEDPAADKRALDPAA
ncbi:glycosyltransferase family 87 protein [Corynebacterium felinum]|uniref:Alpha-1,2-mannosyltransferase n=1 Tax=Corynebacterium felinum TaxID=131318 RepID=A0ABU2BDC1_9CORY|nr:glycosyltransferase family 87 protein [Corynebacterium felinum]MDF5821807.1 glycosyltransferase family 87 protein [Corynebacterium felinum]MDR7355384.1 alpha-1,2-mannosyltransferase [Corynebacterium felinum]WJY94736.1 Polyprenol-phosphate-mannose-dependent alpha-(1-2)-phosphatidylinositol mannoside mannosyltransferase [Corynebacterium felinum]